jgi:TolB-like protein
MKHITLLALLALILGATATSAQNADPVTVAIFPFKNLYGFEQHDTLSWDYADSLYAYLNRQAPAGTRYQLVTMDDIRDQMLAQNVDVKSPSYETDVWKIAKLLGARLVVWGTYLVKYEKSNIEVKVVDVKTLMHDPVNYAEKVRVPFPQSLETVPTVGDKIIGALK